MSLKPGKAAFTTLYVHEHIHPINILTHTRHKNVSTHRSIGISAASTMTALNAVLEIQLCAKCSTYAALEDDIAGIHSLWLTGRSVSL